MSTGVSIPSFTDMTPSQLQHWLSLFILEVRKQNGDVYPPSSLHHITAGLMRHRRWSGRDIDILQYPKYTDFRATLDSEMKRLQGEGVGSEKRQEEIITEEKEEQLWQKGILGDHTLQSLLDTMVFCNEPYFALCSGKEHRQLSQSPCQIELV